MYIYIIYLFIFAILVALKKTAVKELQNVIIENRTKKCLRMYISLLSDKIMKTDRVEVVLLFGFLSKVYGLDLVDPLDKRPSLLKTVIRLCEEIYTYVSKGIALVEQACAKSLSEIFLSSLPDPNNKLVVVSIFYDPLARIIASGGNPEAQSKAAYILNYMMNFWIENDYFELCNYLSSKIVSLYIKTSCTDSELTKCIILILNN